MLVNVLTYIKRSLSRNIYLYICIGTGSIWKNTQEMSNRVSLRSGPRTRRMSWRDTYSSLYILLNFLLKKYYADPLHPAPAPSRPSPYYSLSKDPPYMLITSHSPTHPHLPSEIHRSFLPFSVSE